MLLELVLVQDLHPAVNVEHDVEVEVAEYFRLGVALTPVLGEAERARLPPHEIQNLALGQSALTDRATADLDMQFRISGSQYELLD